MADPQDDPPVAPPKKPHRETGPRDLKATDPTTPPPPDAPIGVRQAWAKRQKPSP